MLLPRNGVSQANSPRCCFVKVLSVFVTSLLPEAAQARTPTPRYCTLIFTAFETAAACWITNGTLPVTAAGTVTAT